MSFLKRLLAVAAMIPTGSLSAAVLPPVFLNHLFIVVDADTTRAIEQSEFLTKEFGAYAKKRNANGTHAWEGHYFTGEQTYIELFDAAGSPSPGARLGLALGVDHTGELKGVDEKLQRKLKPELLPSVGELSKDEKQRPWFWVTEIALSKDDSANLWLMEYVKGFIPDTDEVSRKTHNRARYEARKLFRNVKEVRLSLPKESYEIFLQVMPTLGYKMRQARGGVVLTGPNATLNVSLGPVARVTQIRLSLNSVKAGAKIFRLGCRSTLVFSSRFPSAIWNFVEPSPAAQSVY